MKISKERLKQIIQEEIENTTQQTDTKQNVKALGQFSAKLLELSKEIKQVKGLDTKEMTEILDIFSDLVKFASGKSGGALIAQISSLINKKTGIEQ